MNKLFCYLLALFFTTSYANASIFDGASNHNLYTHTQSYSKPEPASFLTLDWQFAPHKNKLASTHWLPDYLGKNMSRTNDGGNNAEVKGICSTYNTSYLDSEPDANKYDFTTKNNVDGQGLKCYTDIRCKAKFKYNSSNCSADYQLAGSTCNDKYDACIAKPCSTGGYFDTAQADKKCSPVTYGGRTCQSCYQPQCSEGGLDTTQKSGFICTAKTYYGHSCYSCVTDPCYGLSVPSQPYGCQSTYPQCPSKCQVAYPDNCHNRNAKSCDYGCQSNFADCSSKCETCKSCTPVRPDSSFIEGYGSCWPGQTLVTSSDGCGKPFHKCTGAATCTSQGFVDACPSGQTGTSVTGAGGGKCFKDCKVSNVPCRSPYSKDVTSCTSPYTLYTQSDNTKCGQCVNQCSGYSTSPNCMTKSYIQSNSGYGDETYNMLYEMGQPAMHYEEECLYDKRYKRCTGSCSNVSEFVSKMKDGMKRTLCSLSKMGVNDSYYSLCDGGFSGINFLRTDYNVYIRLLDEGTCGVTAETNIRTCRNMMDAAKNYVPGC